MKDSIVFKVVMFLFFSTIMMSQSKRDYFSVTGITHGNYSGYLYLDYNDTRDSCKVVNNQFYFKGKMPIIGTGSFIIGKGPTIMTQDFYLENVDINLELTLTKKTVRNVEYDWVIINSVSGTKTSSIEKDYEMFKTKHEKDKSWQAKRYNKLDSIISKYPDHPYSLGLLVEASWDSLANKQRLQQLYQKLDLSSQDPQDILRLRKNIFGSLKIGKPMTNFELPNEKEKLINTNQYRGSVLLIDFWASWCAPCREQIPKVKKLYEKYKNKNFKILTISLDKSKEKWVSALKKENMLWDNVLESRDFSSPIVKEYEIISIPSSFLIDANGIIVGNDMTITELDDYLSKNLK